LGVVDWLGIVSVCDTSVNKFVLSSLISFKCLNFNLFFSVDKSIDISMVIEINLSILIVNLNHLFPIVRFLRLFIVFNGFKFVWESSSHDKLISSESKVRSDFFDNQADVVFENAYSLN
jgi:hypothetical protein